MAIQKVVSQEKLAITKFIWKYFVNRYDKVTYLTHGHSRTEYRPITLEDILKHLNGEIILAIHAISEKNTCKWVAYDIDTPKLRVISELQTILRKYEKSWYIEWSGRRGYHFFVLFDPPIPLELAKSFLSQYNIYNIDVKPMLGDLPPDVNEDSCTPCNKMTMPLGKHYATLNFAQTVCPEKITDVKPSREVYLW